MRLDDCLSSSIPIKHLKQSYPSSYIYLKCSRIQSGMWTWPLITIYIALIKIKLIL